MRIAGTARSVYGATVVSLRYQVDPAASSAKFGNSSASIAPLPSSSDSSGNSSNMTMTTRLGCLATTPDSASTLPPNTTADAGDPKRNIAANNAGAIARNRSHDAPNRAGRTRARRANPLNTPRCTSRTGARSVVRFRISSTKIPNGIPHSTACA